MRLKNWLKPAWYTHGGRIKRRSDKNRNDKWPMASDAQLIVGGEFSRRGNFSRGNVRGEFPG